MYRLSFLSNINQQKALERGYLSVYLRRGGLSHARCLLQHKDGIGTPHSARPLAHLAMPFVFG